MVADRRLVLVGELELDVAVAEIDAVERVVRRLLVAEAEVPLAVADGVAARSV